MPVKPKPPKPPKPGTADVNTPPRTPVDATPHDSALLHLTSAPFMRRSPPDTSEPGSSTPQIETAAAPHSLQVHPIASTSATFSLAATPYLQDYLIPSTADLPEANTQGFRVFNSRLYADVQGGGTVLVGIDGETGLHRAQLHSERWPSGPELAYDPLHNHWYMLPDVSASADGGAVVARKSRRVSRQSDEAYESALEELPDDVDTAQEHFYMASESMPVKPFTNDEQITMRSETRFSYLGNQPGIYDRGNNGKYPFRDLDGRPVRIKKLQTLVRFDDGGRYTSEQVKPYIKFGAYESVARLYEEKLQWRLFTEADMRTPGERALIGQSLVVANRRITRGEVVGVYAGAIMPGRLVPLSQQSYTMKVGIRYQPGPGYLIPEQLALVGDTIISRINTYFWYDATGKPVRQATDGYNVEFVPFTVEAQQWIGKKLVTRDFILNAIFATEDIPAGTELRINYNYSDADIATLFP
ncbi:hypothetical protein [Pseudomonas sp. A34-9]|uniref:hypothetical protein n=1 Tax=Pseudomonas sp. A34-9 TaxID=3034675 RepID=UPI00240D88BA|nr:hypothetical protein [Pseudomonas sp. A34-9]